MTHYVMVVDTKRCVGCNNCSMTCKVENNIPEGIWWSRSLTDGGEAELTPRGDTPDTMYMRFLTLACQHCENPAGVKVCPVGATYRDEETGIVRQDYDKCIGCRMCMSACPYTGVRSFNWEEPQYAIGQPMGSLDIPQHQKQVVEKCTMCWHRLAQGEKPACIDPCPARIRFWGDFDDPSSEVSQLIREREYQHLLPEQGTKPSVYYLV